MLFFSVLNDMQLLEILCFSLKKINVSVKSIFKQITRFVLNILMLLVIGVAGQHIYQDGHQLYFSSDGLPEKNKVKISLKLESAKAEYSHLLYLREENLGSQSEIQEKLIVLKEKIVMLETKRRAIIQDLENSAENMIRYLSDERNTQEGGILKWMSQSKKTDLENRVLLFNMAKTLVTAFFMLLIIRRIRKKV